MEDYKECTDCVHYEFCLSQEKYLIEHNRKDLIRRYGFGLHEVEHCKFFKDRSRFVDMTEIKQNVIRPLCNRCAALTDCQTCLACALEIREHCNHYKQIEQALKERDRE